LVDTACHFRGFPPGVERNGPTGGGPARIAQCEQAGAGWGERVADRTTVSEDPAATYLASSSESSGMPFPSPKLFGILHFK
jgi:hypothetical protein